MDTQMNSRWLALALLCATSGAGASDIRLSGTVYDRVGNPVFGAEVALTRAGESNFSSPQGSWSLEGNTSLSQPAGGLLDSLVVTWKDSARESFPVYTYVQSGRNLVLQTIQVADPPRKETADSRASKDEDRDEEDYDVPMAPPAIQIAGPFGQNLTFTRTQAPDAVRQFRQSAIRSRKIGKGFLVGGLAGLGVGGLIALSSDVEENTGTFITGCTIATLGLVFASASAGTFSTASYMERSADEIQRQLDEYGPSSRRREHHPLPARVAIQIRF